VKLKRFLIGTGLFVACMGAAIAYPIMKVENRCILKAEQQPAPSPAFKIDDPDYLRAEGDSFLSYPEWYIVHAYADLAGVTGQSSESTFDYFGSIQGFWTSLCEATQVASRIGSMTDDQKTTNYVIGISFTAEMGLQGAYERTIGAATVWLRNAKTPEDVFNQKLLENYAIFLNQTPWYQFPFGSELARLWRETPFTVSIRSIERRFSLSLQYSVKALYAAAIRYAAGYAPAALKIKSVITGLDDASLAANTNITKVRDVQASDGTQATLIETPRYQEFSEIARKLSDNPNARLIEIAGNRRILTTVIVPAGKTLQPGDATPMFSLPIQSRPGTRRVGLNTPVAGLLRQMHDAQAQGYQFEHAYDY
jgi:hypothetical protein